MSQYRPEDAGGHPVSEVKSREVHQSNLQSDISVKTEAQDTHVNHTFVNTIRSDYPEEYASKISGIDYPSMLVFAVCLIK